MADTVIRLKTIHSGFDEWFTACTERLDLVSGYLNRIVKQDYLISQQNRFDTNNAGPDFEGGAWASLDPKYAEYKRKRYAAFPGSGTQTNVRQSNLLSSLLLTNTYYPNPEPRKIRAGRKGKKSAGQLAAGSLVTVDTTSIHIYTLVPYAKYVDEDHAKRTFTQWSQVFWDRINRGIMNYLAGK